MDYTWEAQSFDSDILGFSVAKISYISSEKTPLKLQETIRALIKELKKAGVKYGVYRLPANNFPLIHALEFAGFVTVDGILGMNLLSAMVDPITNKNIRKAEMKDLPNLKRMVKRSFTANRFYNDPIIDIDKADIIYEKWVENSLLGSQADEVLVYEEEKEILGFITLQKKGHIPLAAVSAKARGRGIAKKLIKESFGYFQKWDCASIEIETSLGNIPALRAYEGCGFKICNSFVTLRWSSI